MCVRKGNERYRLSRLLLDRIFVFLTTFSPAPVSLMSQFWCNRHIIFSETPNQGSAIMELTPPRFDERELPDLFSVHKFLLGVGPHWLQVLMQQRKQISIHNGIDNCLLRCKTAEAWSWPHTPLRTQVNTSRFTLPLHAFTALCSGTEAPLNFTLYWPVR